MYLKVIAPLVFFLAACAPPAPNPVVQELEMNLVKVSAILSQSVAIESAYKRKDIVKNYDVADKDTTMVVSTKYVEPFQGCARYNTAYRHKKTGFFGYEKNYDFIYKICEQDEELYNVELISPNVPGLTGVKDLIDIRRTPLYAKQGQ